MGVKLDYTNMMVSAVGEFGIEEEELDRLQGRVKEIHRDLTGRRKQGALPFYDLPFDRQMVREVAEAAEELVGQFDNVVVLGIGGSALGTTALGRALLPLYHNQLGSEQRGGRPRLFVLDNVDPVGIDATLEQLEPQNTLFLVISKSGSTVETMSQFMIARQWMEDGVGQDYRRHFVLITDPVTGGLRRLAQEEGYRDFAVPPGVGGRFTVFTPVGLLPLAMAGVDIEALMAGAGAMEARVCREELFENPAYLNAALQFLAYRKGMKVSVMMPYSDRLQYVADWYGQLWAESLGKKKDLAGRTVHVGPTPVKALGPTDQHSQVQLYVEGPFDKTVTFLALEDFGCDRVIPEFPSAPNLSYLSGHSLSELVRYEQQATAVALAENGRPNCTITLDAATADNLGALLYLFQVQTVFAGGLFGIDPLDQPGVEEGKEYTYALMGRDGFEGKLQQFQERLRQHPPRVL